MPRSPIANDRDGEGRCVIVGLGNPIRGDDAVGLVVAGAVHARLAPPAAIHRDGGPLADPHVDLCELAAGGIDLIESLIGYQRAVIIDAALAGVGGPVPDPEASGLGTGDGGRPGECYRLPLDAGPGSLRTGLSHEIGLLEGLELGRRLGLAMPQDLAVYAIRVADPFTVTEGLTDAVRAAVPGIVARILAEQFSQR